MTERVGLKLRVYQLLLAIISLSCCALETNGADSQIPAYVSRRHSGDFVIFRSGGSFRCGDNNLTYLVNERQCVRNQELLNGCNFSIALREDHSNITLSTLIRTTNQQRSLLKSPTLTEAVIANRGTHQLVNSSLCHISTLEVYRGRQQAYEIVHDGFSLADNGTIKIIVGQLGYSLQEYDGELYRMNLSCSGGGLPQSGCLFFKVIAVTNITRAKFNNSVPGALNREEEDVHTTNTGTLSTDSIGDSSSSSAGTSTGTSTVTKHNALSTTGTSNTLNPDETSGPDFFIYVIVAATGIVALLFVVVLLSMVLAYCCSLDRKRNRQSVTVATNLWFEQRDLIAINSPGPPFGANTLDTIQ